MEKLKAKASENYDVEYRQHYKKDVTYRHSRPIKNSCAGAKITKI